MCLRGLVRRREQYALRGSRNAPCWEVKLCIKLAKGRADLEPLKGTPVPVSRPLCTALESRVKTEGVRGRGSALYSNHSMQAQACWVCLTNIIIMYLVPTPYVLINPRFPKTMPSIRQNRPDEIGVIDLTGTCINSLQQLIHLLIAHLLAQIR